MGKTITLSRNGATRTIPTGFSWTVLFFGIVPMMIHREWSFIMFYLAANVASVVATDALVQVIGNLTGVGRALGILLPFVLFAGHIYCAAIRNRNLRIMLLADGWTQDFKVNVNGATAMGGDATNDAEV